MMFDSVREELQVKITSGRLPKAVQDGGSAKPVSFATASANASWAPEPKPVSAAKIPEPAVPSPSLAPRPAAREAAPERPVKRVETAGLAAPKTSPTLVGFQPKAASIPDWRLQLQNAVQQRKGTQGPIAAAAPLAPVAVSEPPVAAAAVAAPAAIADPRVANALKRIDTSRDRFQQPTRPVSLAPPAKPAPKPFRLEVVAPEKKIPARIEPPVVERKVAAPIQVTKRDTNKLPRLHISPPPAIETAAVAPIIEDVAAEIERPTPTAEFSQVNRIRIAAEVPDIDTVETAVERQEDIEDLAHFSMRFGAGLFDLIITSFASLLILSPVAFARSEWFTVPALLTFAGTLAIVTFVYMTLCLGFFGKTMGMRLFALELVDAVENEYPTLHQAAVNSSVYILSLVLGGSGFLTMLFNEEKRAAHDLLSGTILVREF